MVEIENISKPSSIAVRGTLVSPIAHAILIGSLASGLLKSSLSGRVMTIFERSLYLAVNGNWICLADVSLGFGPLTVSVKSINGREWISRFRVGRLVKLSSESISIDDSTIISIKGVRSWEPPKTSIWTKNSLLLGLRALEKLVESNVPDKGLGKFIFECPDRFTSSDESLAAEHSIEILKNWLKKCFEFQIPIIPDKEAISSLIGLGPGLTPSGDDFLGGMLIALHICGQKTVKNNLYSQLEYLIDRTGPVSIAHLKAANLGECSQSMHQLINLLLEGNEAHLKLAIAAIDQIGHTSGWDALAGVVVVFRQLVSTSYSAQSIFHG